MAPKKSKPLAPQSISVTYYDHSWPVNHLHVSPSAPYLLTLPLTKKSFTLKFKCFSHPSMNSHLHKISKYLISFSTRKYLLSLFTVIDRYGREVDSGSPSLYWPLNADSVWSSYWFLLVSTTHVHNRGNLRWVFNVPTRTIFAVRHQLYCGTKWLGTDFPISCFGQEIPSFGDHHQPQSLIIHCNIHQANIHWTPGRFIHKY